MTRYDRYKKFIRSHPCVACGSPHSEVAHLRGMVSPKTGLVMDRSHKTPAKWCAVPLCAECHRTGRHSIHNMIEEEFWIMNGREPNYGLGKAYSLFVTFAS